MAALRLSVHPPAGPAGRILLAGAIALLSVGAVNVFHHWVIELVPFLLSNPPSSVGAALPWLWSWLWVVVLGLGAPAIPVLLALRAFRDRATLDGTVLTVRGLLRTGSADLAVAAVHGETRPEHEGGDLVLVALMPGRTRPVRLVLGDPGGLLPRPQLAALADAVAAGGRADERRCRVVDRLRLHVRQPFAVPRYLWADPSPRP